MTKCVAHLKEYLRLCLTLFQIDPQDYAVKLHTWMKEGFKELGDLGGMGIGKTTSTILRHPDFQSDPHMVCFNRNCIGQFRDIPLNQTTDVHRQSTLITRVIT